MELVIILLALAMLMFIAYKGFSVIIFVLLCALFAVFLTYQVGFFRFIQMFLWQKWLNTFNYISRFSF